MPSRDGQADSLGDGMMKRQELHFRRQCLHLTVDACCGFDSAFLTSILVTRLLLFCLRVLASATAGSKTTGETAFSG